MDLDEVKLRIEEVEPLLADRPFVQTMTLSRDGRDLVLCLTERLRRIARREKVWKSRKFLATVKNAAYGFDSTRQRSLRGADGLFLLDRDHRPENEMMRKIFGRYLDRKGSGVDDVARELGAEVGQLLPVRLVSHHMRLLGLLHQGTDKGTLVLVDLDDEK